MRAIKLGLATIALLLLYSEAAYACSCAPPPPVAESVSQSSAVFSGKVIKVRRIKSEAEAWLWEVEVVFEVNTSWKGAERKTISVFTASQSAACGYNFRSGMTYLVYAHADPQRGLATTICSRTKRLKDAREELKELGEGKVIRRTLTDMPGGPSGG